MLSLHSRLRRSGEDIAAKVIDGEAIILNLANGVYYSMDKVGGLIWAMIEDGYGLEAIVEALTERYDVSRQRAQSDVQELAAALLQEKLVTVTDGALPSPAKQEWSVRPKLSYESPTLQIYRDMGDLLALDPPGPGLDDIRWTDPDEGSSS